MYRRICIAAAVCLALLLTACGKSFDKRADEAAVEFLNAMLARDGEKLKTLVHPGHTDELTFDDGFYEVLAGIEIYEGMELNGLDAAGKVYNENDEDVNGKVYVCAYVAKIDQMFYDISLVFLENDAGFGLIAASAGYCTDESYYQ